MERPPGSLSRFRLGCHTLAQVLLYTEQEAEAHLDLLRGAFDPAPAEQELAQVAALTLSLTELRPAPRLRVIRDRLRESTPLRKWFAKTRFVLTPAAAVPRMRRWPDTSALPVLETAGELAQWLRIDVPYLYWMADLGDRNRRSRDAAVQHYNVRRVAKPDGSMRLVEAPKQLLRHVQRQLLHELLDRVAVSDAVHGFRTGRSIRTFGEPHVGRAMVLRLDLANFFASISGPRVQATFRTLGYPEPVADLLGALCTTITPRAVWNVADPVLNLEERQTLRRLYDRPHLPQGAPTSPAVANVCAYRLDRRLAAMASAAGASYTRYADDLAFSGDTSFARGAGRFALHVAAIATEEGFPVHPRKTRLMRASERQQLAGVVVNHKPNLPRADLERLEAILTNCVRRGPEGQNRSGHPDFRAYLEGKVAFVHMVNPQRGEKLRTLVRRIAWP